MDYKTIFENYTLENFKELFESHKLSEASIEEQREIKEALNDKITNGYVTLNRCRSDLSKLDQKESELYNDVADFERLEQRGYAVSEGKAKAQKEMDAVKKLRSEIKKEFEKQKEMVEYLETTLKQNKFSKQERQILDVKEKALDVKDAVSEKASDIKETVSKKANDVKIKIKSAPQKICSANISLLSKLRQKGKEKYHNIMDKFKNKVETLNQEMEEIHGLEKNIDDKSVIAKEFKREEFKKSKKRILKKAMVYAGSAYVLAKLRSGVVRSFDVSLDFYNKMNKDKGVKLKAA